MISLIKIDLYMPKWKGSVNERSLQNYHKGQIKIAMLWQDFPVIGESFIPWF